MGFSSAAHKIQNHIMIQNIKQKQSAGKRQTGTAGNESGMIKMVHDLNHWLLMCPSIK